MTCFGSALPHASHARPGGGDARPRRPSTRPPPASSSSRERSSPIKTLFDRRHQAAARHAERRHADARRGLSDRRRIQGHRALPHRTRGDRLPRLVALQHRGLRAGASHRPRGHGAPLRRTHHPERARIALLVGHLEMGREDARRAEDAPARHGGLAAAVGRHARLPRAGGRHRPQPDQHADHRGLAGVDGGLLARLPQDQGTTRRGAAAAAAPKTLLERLRTLDEATVRTAVGKHLRPG